jgi:uracil-DNA glycosylase
VEGFLRATHGNPVPERTATEIWKLIPKLHSKVFLWNAFPFHPYNIDEPLSNRKHTKREFTICQDILSILLNELKPKNLVALGADAFQAVSDMGYEVHRVRHPSYGGHREFAKNIQDIYKTCEI